jgi:1,6-anhydro-N-acetylmuramate kinase
MIIADLQHLEDVTQESNAIEGGWKFKKYNVNEALAEATATAIGSNSYTATYTDAKVVLGGGSSSASGSYAKTWG